MKEYADSVVTSQTPEDLTCTESRECLGDQTAFHTGAEHDMFLGSWAKVERFDPVVSFAFSPDARCLCFRYIVYYFYCIIKHRKIALAHRTNVLWGQLSIWFISQEDQVLLYLRLPLWLTW